MRGQRVINSDFAHLGNKKKPGRGGREGFVLSVFETSLGKLRLAKTEGIDSLEMNCVASNWRCMVILLF